MRRDELSLPDPLPNDRPGDRWMCGRSGSDLPCARGPSRFGRCPLADACRPQRTWHGRRKQIASCAITLMVILLAVLLQPRWRVEALKPGGLATPHAQILSGTLTSDRCASCHPQAATSRLGWFSKAQPGHADVSQTDRCLNCHHTTIDRPLATLAHNLPQATRSSIRLATPVSARPTWHDRMPSPAIDQENIQCNVCHREHHGADHDLSAVSDRQCQTCHADRFGSFATSHPQWDLWPYGRGRRIAFNHATHANKHFPASGRAGSATPFQCADCHHKTSGNELTRVTTYQRGCKSCHDDGLKIQAAAGIELFALPSLPEESAKRVGKWPAAGIGFYDGQLAPLTELLFRSDPETELSIRNIPDADFGRIDPAENRSVQAAIQIGQAYQKLISSISTDGQNAITNRFIVTGVTPSSASALVQSLPTQLITRAGQDWFGSQHALDSAAESNAAAVHPSIAADPQDDLLSDSDLLIHSDPLADDPLLQIANEKTNPRTRFDPDQMLAAGGWYRDDVRLAIRYRGAGHADPVLKSAIDLVSQLPASDPVRRRLLNTPAVAACIACHPAAVTSATGWISQPMIGQQREFTKFSHGPHLNVARLADCIHCHRIGTAGTGGTGGDHPVTVNFAQATTGLADFLPLGREACASCHTPQAAGDACVKCHRYHIDLR